MLMVTLVFAEDPSRIPAGAEPGVLLLHTGRVIQGNLIRTGDDYTLERENGSMFVPGKVVRMQCRDLHDAYEQQRQQIPRHDEPAHRMTLARWCLTYQLVEEARQELRTVLKLNPEREDARKLLLRVNEILDPEKPVATTPVPRSRAARDSEYHAVEIESLGGLSRDTAQYFTRRVQPILMNNCSLSGCHAADSPNGFQLVRSAGNESTRYTSERNLAAVLKFIDEENPDASRLLTVPHGNHGRRGRPVFGGHQGATQMASLRLWVQAIASERNPARHEILARHSTDPDERSLASVDGRMKENRESTDSSAVDPNDPFTFGKQAVGSPVKSAAGSQVDAVRQNPADPFDPTEFNRQTLKRAP
jgi:hypothetical protein